MKIHFKNGTQIEIELLESVVSPAVEKSFKHLQHIPLNFKKWDNPFYIDFTSKEDLIDDFVLAGKEVGIQVDANNCMTYNQLYFNQLHKLFETGYDGNPKWLDYHELLHLCELKHQNFEMRSVVIDFRESAGLLTRPFNNEYLTNMITKISPGMVYIEWSELGKTPHRYWLDKEPEDPNRLAQLAKPWLHLRPKFLIATQYIDMLSNIDPKFHTWWQRFEPDWCKHWEIESWPVERIKGVIQIGTIKQIDTMLEQFRQRIPVVRISL